MRAVLLAQQPRQPRSGPACGWLLLLCTLALVACAATRKSASRPSSKPELVAGLRPVAPFVAEQLLTHSDARTVVYVGANWCEPCQRFHRALQAGELDGRYPGVRFIEYDLDAAHSDLDVSGYGSRLIPLFALPAADGRCSTQRIEGSIKGAGAVDNIVPRLSAMLAAAGKDPVPATR